jgi:hypothetical protein
MRRVMLVLALVVQGGTAAAQAVGGRVVSDAGTAVPGAVVTALDSAGVPILAALADDSGRFALRLPSAGRFQLQVLRVGYAPTLDNPLRLEPGATAKRTIIASAARTELPDEQREASPACYDPAGSSSLEVVWGHVRTALLSTRLTRLTRGYTMDVEVMARREFADRRRPTINDRTVLVGTPLRALTSVPPEELASTGYLSRTPTGDRFQAPHEDVLLSDSFEATHCLRLLPWDATAATLRIGFEPIEGRQVPDVRGIITLDRATLELRRVEFTYTGLTRAGTAGDAGGEITFRRLPDASWITGSWLLTQSIAEQYVAPRPLVAGRFGAPPSPRPEITSGVNRIVTGGTVTRIRARDAVVWSSTGAPDREPAAPTER